MPDFDFILTIKRISVAFIPLMLGIILHEVAHGWMAARRGDPTAAMMGRLTLNPLPHIDPMGLLFFVLTSLLGPVVLGWAKPVPINPRHFRNISRDVLAVSLAGPAANFLLAFLSAGLLRLYLFILPYQEWNTSGVWEFFFLMLYTSISINCALAWFNLMPVPPLDGSKILWSLLPPAWGMRYMQLERYGMMLIILLLLLGAFSYIMYPVISFSVKLLLSLFGL